MAATNRPEILDAALLRPGSFDRQILEDRPDIKGRTKILELHGNKVKLSAALDLAIVAAKTPGFVGADLANIVNEAALLAARQDKQSIDMAEFDEAIERVVAGLQKKSHVINPKEKKIVAYHESGHALVDELISGADPVSKISIIPRGVAALGYTTQLPTEDRYLMTRSELLARIDVLLGGTSRGGDNLIVGGGVVAFHFGAAMHAVRKTIERHRATIEPGDIILSNDPHDGGGLHPQDLMVQRPLFVGDRLIAWICLSAHMIDVGGAVPGSFSPAATECYQEALRMPPVRLFRRGEETDVWDIIRTNVRMATIVEMDLRALVAGSHVDREKVVDLAAALGIERFLHDIRTIRTLSEQEMRHRIATLADGLYRVTAWTQWGTEVYRIPCALTVNGDRLVFD